METVIPPFVGHGHSRVMSWVVEEALAFFQTAQAVVKYSPAGEPWGGPCGQDALQLKALGPRLQVGWFGSQVGYLAFSKAECPDERALDLIRRMRFQFILQILALNLYMPKAFHYSLA